MSETNHNITTQVAKKLISGQRDVQIEVRGWSMLPYLRPGDQIVLSFCAPGDLREGDIVTYESHLGKWVTHRFLRHMPNGALLCKGDAVRKKDPPVRPEEYVGKVVAYQRKGRMVRVEDQIIRNRMLYHLRGMIPYLVLGFRGLHKLTLGLDHKNQNKGKP